MEQPPQNRYPAWEKETDDIAYEKRVIKTAKQFGLLAEIKALAEDGGIEILEVLEKAEYGSKYAWDIDIQAFAIKP